ncbi:MAG: hypothetical protein K2L05_08935, partial [Muribaculaceae bacterium]|nr:hypothetical protein [Muribaculaceae bacterium]
AAPKPTPDDKDKKKTSESPQPEAKEKAPASTPVKKKQKKSEPQAVSNTNPNTQNEGSQAHGCGCLVLLAVIVALAGYFLNWWSLPLLPDREESSAKESANDEQIAEIYSQIPESQLINIIQLANKAQTSGITPEFAAVVKQYIDAPNEVWEGGISKPDFSPELLVEQSELGEVLNVDIIDQTYSDDGRRAEILFDYCSQINDYCSDKRRAIAYLVNDGDSWLVEDFRVDYSQYPGGMIYNLAENMKQYIQESNTRIQTGKTMRELREFFEDNPEALRNNLSYVKEYSEKYNLSIPDSLTHYFIYPEYIDKPAE